jgi:hypothetical protein
MRPLSDWIRLSLLAALTLATLSACGGGAAGESAGGERSAGVRASVKSSPCPSVTDMSAAMGTSVTFTQSIGSSPWMTCQYELTGRYRGVFIELTTQPTSRADEVYAELRRLAKGMKGEAATPDSVHLGEGGLAVGSGSMSRAAVLAKGRLYQAEMGYMGFGSLGDQKEAMVRVLEMAIR